MRAIKAIIRVMVAFIATVLCLGFVIVEEVLTLVEWSIGLLNDFIFSERKDWGLVKLHTALDCLFRLRCAIYSNFQLLSDTLK